jgi:hypothetical protein
MLFHVTAQHSWETCEGNAKDPSPMAERSRWVEGTDDVKVIGAWSCTPEHTAFAIVEATDATKLHQFFRPQGLRGKVEITPVGDHIANRKANGDWGK